MNAAMHEEAGRRAHRDAFAGIKHLVGHEAALRTVDVFVAEPWLLRHLIFERCAQMQFVARAGHRDIEQAALFLDELRLAG